MFEIWRHRASNRRYLVVYRDGHVSAAAGPLSPHENPVEVLEHRSNQNHDPYALLHMLKMPEAYEREYAIDRHGRVFNPE